MKRAIFLAILLAFPDLAPAGAANLPQSKRDMRTNPPGSFLAPGYYIPGKFSGETVTIACSDGYSIAGDLISRRGGGKTLAPVVLFLHEAGKTRRSWYPITVQTVSRGYVSLAIDLRGCGENPSLNKASGSTLDKMPESETRKMIEDIRNVLSFISMKAGVDPGRIMIVGSGIGANLALAVAAEPWAQNVKAVAAISPVLDDRGYRADESVKKAGRIYICLAATQGDTASYEAVKALYKLAPGRKELFEGEGAAHGVGIFGARSVAPFTGEGTPPVFYSYLAQWIYQGISGKYPVLPPARKPVKR